MSEALKIKVETFVEGRKELEVAIQNLKDLIGTVDKGDSTLGVFAKELRKVTEQLDAVNKATKQVKTPDYSAATKVFNEYGEQIKKVDHQLLELEVKRKTLASAENPLIAVDPKNQAELDGYIKKCDELSKQYHNLYTKQHAVSVQMAELKANDKQFYFIDYDKAIGELDKAKSKVQDLSDGVKQLYKDRADAEKKATEEAQLNAKIQASEYKDTADAITNVIQRVNALNDAERSMRTPIEKAESATKMGQTISGASVEEYTKAFASAQQSVTELEEKTKKLGETLSGLSDKMPKDMYNYLRNKLGDANLELNAMKSSIQDTGNRGNAVFGSLAEQLEKIRAAEKKIEEVDIGKAMAFGDQNTIDRYNAMVASLNAMVTEFTKAVNVSDMQTQVNTQLSASWLKIDQLIDSVTAKVSTYRRAATTDEQAAQYKEMVATLERLKAASARYRKSVKDTDTAHKSGSKSTAQYKASMKDLSTAVKDAKQNFEKMNKAVSKIAGSIGSKLKNGLKTIMKYVLGFRSLFFLVRKVRGMIKEGLDNLVQFQSATNETNHQMTELQSSLLFLKNAFGAMIAPVLNVVLPVLNTLIDALANVGNAIARFFAQLTGQATVIQAVKVGVQDYADSLKDAGKSAGSAAKKAKDLHDRLAPFDDLQVLGVDKDKNKDGSGGGGGAGDDLMPSIDEMFKRISTGRGLGDMLKDALERGNLFGVGQYIGELIKKGIDSIDWEAIKEKLSSGITLVTSFLNGLLTTKGLFSSIGTGLAEGFNTLIGGIKQFFDEIQWSEIYAGIGEGLTSFFSTIDYEQILQTAISIAQSFVGAITGFFSTFDLAPAINKLFNALKKTINSKKFKELLSDLKKLPAVFFDWINKGIEDIDWKTLGEALGDGLSSMFDDVEGDTTLGNSLSGKISRFFSDIFWAGFKIQTGLWERIITSISDKIAQVLSAKREPFIQFLGKFLMDLATGMLSVRVMAIVLKKILTSITPVLSEVMAGILQIMGKDVSAEDLQEIGQNIIDGVFEGMKKAPEAINSWIKENIVDPIITGFKTLFGIASPSTVMEEYGGYVMEGVLEGMKGVVEDVIEVFTDLKDKAIAKMQAFKLKAMLVWQLIKTTFVTMATKIKDAVATPFTDMKDNLIATVNTMKNKIVTLWRLMWGGIKGIINNILEGVESFCNNIIDGINDVIDALDFTDKIPDAVKEKLNIEDVSITKLEHISIPRLATGAVIPPNREFLAMLGDQKSGTNIEAPLDTIVDAFREVVGNLQVENTGSAVMQVDGQTFARLMTPYVVSELGRRGYDVKIIGG